MGVQQQPAAAATTTTTASSDIDMAEVLMHWNQYESAREFPSPLNKSEELQYETNFKKLPTARAAAGTRSRRKMVPINPVRFVEDSLPILATENYNNQERRPYSSPTSTTTTTTAKSATPVMVRKSDSSSQQLDVNTAWVEMLIHSEQRKFAMTS